MIMVERLVFSVFLEKRGTQSVNQIDILNVDIRVMDKSTGFHISVGINMQVAAASRNTSIYIFAVVPEIENKARLGGAEFSHLMIHKFALLGSCQQFGNRTLANGNISKIPTEFTAFCNHGIDPVFRSDHLGVLAVITGGKAENDTMLLQNIHRIHYLLISSFTAPHIGFILITLHTDSEH